MVLALAIASPLSGLQAASQKVLVGPSGSGSFGQNMTPLPNGNFVVVDSNYSLSPMTPSSGAVYLYNSDGVLISTLIGTNTNDQVGLGGIYVLPSGHFVVQSLNWGGNRGAVTWGHAATGFPGGPLVAVSASNSLVGSVPGDTVGMNGISLLPNGHYVVASSNWNFGLGAVTWCNGQTGQTVGTLSAANSLTGNLLNDNVGSAGVVVLTNSNYVVLSPFVDFGVNTNVGAATFCNGTTGTVGTVSGANSLHGTQSGDMVGMSGVALTNGNYVVCSMLWRFGMFLNVGAATWGNGTTGITGPVSPANSLVGTSPNDQVGIRAVPLTNGNYVVQSFLWDNGPIADAGAATWGSGTGGTVGPVSAINSLVGTSISDLVGANVVALSNGNYVVVTSGWDQTAPPTPSVGAVTCCNGTSGTAGIIDASNSLIGAAAGDQIGGSGVTALATGQFVAVSASWNGNRGAATWGSGVPGATVGVVSAANSLVGSTANDFVGSGGVVALTNGAYVVCSPFWDDGATADAGAVTWGNGTNPAQGAVSQINSLVGSTSNDLVGLFGVRPLTNGHYVVSSPLWDNGPLVNAGAVTWGSGTSGISGPITATNSLVGGTNADQVGIGGVTALTNGNYVVSTPSWTNGALTAVGAVTWGNGATGISGLVSSANSLVGGSVNDSVGSSGITPLANGNYIVRSAQFDVGVFSDAGAVTLGNGALGTSGEVSASNSVTGFSNAAFLSNAIYLPPSDQLVAGSPNENRIILRGNRFNFLGLLRGPAPGKPDIFYARNGPVAVSSAGTVLFDAQLSGPGSAKGKNRAVFGDVSPGDAIGLVMQSGDSLATLTAPANSSAVSFFPPIHQNPFQGLFQITFKGTGINAGNNRLVVRDTGSSINLVAQTGTTHFYGTNFRTFNEVLQSHGSDLVTVNYRLTAPANADTGVLTRRHDGTNTSSFVTHSQEGQNSGLPAVGVLGQFAPRSASTGGSQISFSAIAGAINKPALLRINDNGTTLAVDARVTDNAPGIAGATHRSFPAFTQLNGETLYKTVLAGVTPNLNEAIYSASDLAPRLRKGDPVGGSTITAIERFWPAGINQVLALVRLSDKSQALILRQADAQVLVLARTNQTMPGTGSALLRVINAVDVNPVSGFYAIVGTLTGTTPATNQALWTGATEDGADSPLQLQKLRLPILRLRKGDVYTTPVTATSTVKSILLQPANDIGGAGGRGLQHAVGAMRDTAVTVITNGNARHLLLLPP